MSNTHVFERLEQVVTLIAEHPDYPGKQEVISECLEDIEERSRQGYLSLEQRFRLDTILLKSAPAQQVRCHNSVAG